MNHVATVLAELAEKIDAGKLVHAAEAEGESAAAQRLKAAAKLAKWAERRAPKFVLLRPDNSGKEISREARWRVIVNDEVEPDELPTPKPDAG